jgi:hypothetical protein
VVVDWKSEARRVKPAAVVLWHSLLTDETDCEEKRVK